MSAKLVQMNVTPLLIARTLTVPTPAPARKATLGMVNTAKRAVSSPTYPKLYKFITSFKWTGRWAT